MSNTNLSIDYIISQEFNKHFNFTKESKDYIVNCIIQSLDKTQTFINKFIMIFLKKLKMNIKILHIWTN